MKAGIETNDDCEDYIVFCESSPTGLAGYAIVVDLTDEQVQLVREFEATRKRYNEMVHRVKLTDDLLRSLQAMLAVAAQYTGTQVEGNESELVKLLDDPDVGPHMLEAGRAKALGVAA